MSAKHLSQSYLLYEQSNNSLLNFHSDWKLKSTPWVKTELMQMGKLIVIFKKNVFFVELVKKY